MSGSPKKYRGRVVTDGQRKYLKKKWKYPCCSKRRSKRKTAETTTMAAPPATPPSEKCVPFVLNSTQQQRLVTKMSMESNDAIEKMFLALREYAEKDRALKEEIGSIARELEFCEREIVVLLDRTHAMDVSKNRQVFTICADIIQNRIKPIYEKLASLVSPDVYYKFHDSFRHATQRVVFGILFLHFIEKGGLMNRDELAGILNLQTDGKNGFHLDLEDYLHGILHLAAELARFAVNAVAAGDFVRPFQIANFVRSIDAQFRILNLKNDALRRRFDALKYDLQKCDQVVYDLTIRGMKPAGSLEKGDSNENEFEGTQPKKAKLDPS